MLLFALQNKPAYLQACTANILYIFVIFKCNFISGPSGGIEQGTSTSFDVGKQGSSCTNV